MPTSPDNLDPDARLMLYALDELPQDQRAAFDQRLQSDPQLAADLARLRQSLDASFASIKSFDAHQRLPAGEGVIVRRVMRSLNQWLLTRVVQREQPRHRTLPWWADPSAAAACVIIGFLVWSARQPVVNKLDPGDQVKASLQYQEADAEALADQLETQFDVQQEASADDAMRSPIPGDADMFFLPPRPDQEVSQ